MHYWFKFKEQIASSFIEEAIATLERLKSNKGFTYPSEQKLTRVNEYLGIGVASELEIISLGFIKRISDEFVLHPPCFLELPATSWFAWHYDLTRSASINIPLTEYNSHTIFSVPGSSKDSCKIEECSYSLGNATCLNTKETHAVLNLSTETRYILAIGLGNEYTYEQLLNFCRSNELVV